jgi:hypothetical protein
LLMGIGRKGLLCSRGRISHARGHRAIVIFWW